MKHGRLMGKNWARAENRYARTVCGVNPGERVPATKSRMEGSPGVPRESPLMIRLANLLHEHRDASAEPVKALLQEHSADPVFTRRADTMVKLFRLNRP
jgi:hypothetical protein